MDPALSRRLFADGGTLVLFDVPVGTEVGIDYKSWNTGPKFKGIKMIPPGFHFVYYSAVSKERHTAPRTGFFHFFKSKEVVIKRWNPRFEELSDDDIDHELIKRVTNNLMDMDPSLGPYPYDSFKKWTTLTNYIHQPILERIQPITGTISSVTQISTEKSEEEKGDDVTMETDSPLLAADGRNDSTTESFPSKKDLVFAGVGVFSLDESKKCADDKSISELKMTVISESALRFSDIPQQKHPIGATPTEITLHNLDFTYALETFLECNYKNDSDGILGELQLAFICFIVGQVYDAFEQWKKLVHLLCYSEQSLLKHVNLFLNLIAVLHFQLKEIPDDFFVDIISRNNFLTKTLQVFFSNVAQCKGLDAVLAKKASQFRDSLANRYHWDFTSEPEEDAPTIVDLNQ